MAVLIKNSQKRLTINIKSIKRVTEDLLTFLGFHDRDLSILFVDNRKIKKMNNEFFGRDRPTNVISFSYLDGMPGEVLGDIIISVERADEEARMAEVVIYDRLFALIVHGLVHIMGYDHEAGPGESRKMKYREKKLIAFLNRHDGYQGLVHEEG